MILPDDGRSVGEGGREISVVRDRDGKTRIRGKNGCIEKVAKKRESGIRDPWARHRRVFGIAFHLNNCRLKKQRAAEGGPIL